MTVITNTNTPTTKEPLASLMCNQITLNVVRDILEEHYTEAAQKYWTAPIQFAVHAHEKRKNQHYILGFTIKGLEFYPDRIVAICTDDYNNYTLVLTGFNVDETPEPTLLDFHPSPNLAPSNIVVYLKRHLDSLFQNRARVRVYQELEEPNICPVEGSVTFMFDGGSVDVSYKTELRIYFEPKL